MANEVNEIRQMLTRATTGGNGVRSRSDGTLLRCVVVGTVLVSAIVALKTVLERRPDGDYDPLFQPF